MSAAWDDAKKQPSILGGEVTGEQGARQAGDTSIAEDGLESSAGVGTRVEGPSTGGGEGEEGVKRDGGWERALIYAQLLTKVASPTVRGQVMVE